MLLFQGGFYVFTLIDWYCAALVLFVVSMAECIIMTWLYGKFIKRVL